MFVPGDFAGIIGGTIRSVCVLTWNHPLPNRFFLKN